MRYKDALQNIDTQAALDFLGIKGNLQGAYIKFPCECGAEAAIKIYGVKKNLYFCPTCEKGGNILKLTMRMKQLEYEEAKRRRLKLSHTAKRITKELTLEYELQYTKEAEALGLSKEFCALHQIGVPKGKTMQIIMSYRQTHYNKKRGSSLFFLLP